MTPAVSALEASTRRRARRPRRCGRRRSSDPTRRPCRRELVEHRDVERVADDEVGARIGQREVDLARGERGAVPAPAVIVKTEDVAVRDPVTVKVPPLVAAVVHTKR
jgi:hypothetical protein